jgi:DNA-binding FadR family transcriptional regulator
MNWIEARDRTLEQWKAILAVIGHRDPDELVRWSEAAYGLCDKARDVAHETGQTSGSVCRLCLAYQQQGGCFEARDQFANALLAGNVQRAKAIVEAHIADLEGLELP